MIKKILLILFTILISILFIKVSVAEDYYSYVGKQVNIKMYWGTEYQGKVDSVVPIERCFDSDSQGICIFKVTKYTMFLIVQDKMKIIRCEDILNIEEKE